MSYTTMSYLSPGPDVAYEPDEMMEPVPGWGFLPKMAGPPVIGLGYDLPIKTPVGTTSVSIPLEKAAADAVNMMWPAVKAKMEAELPVLVAALYKEVPTVVSKLRDGVVKDVWPAVQPKVQSQMDGAMANLEQKLNDNQKKMTMIVIGGALAAIGISLYISMRNS